MKKPTIFLAVGLALCGCQRPKVPADFDVVDRQPAIYPDYTEVTVPINIAPLTFELEDSATQMIVRFSAGDELVVCEGLKAQPSMKQWSRLKTAAANEKMSVEIFAQRSGRWNRYAPFSIYVSTDSIDPWLSYRMISPSYVTYEELTLNQRCLESYDERVMVDNMLCGNEATGQCVNCHNYQQQNPQRMQFHARQHHGGTVIVYDGKIKKVNMRNDSTISAGVYPTWHPALPLIVYSTNHTGQSFHTRDLNKIEVFDSASDLILYNVETNEVSRVESDPTEFEVFPFWAPDGLSLYYCSAHFEFRDTVGADVETIRRAKEVKYSLYRKTFDPATLTFGPREMVYDAAALGLSATLPRLSPDGRFLMFTLGEYGVFHIWHRDADLYMMDLTTGDVRRMDEINSTETESYHAWSSTGRWVVFSSRRDDGGYTRPFFAHIDSEGRATKPFELPQRDPDRHRQLMKSYNIPEFMLGPVTVSPQEFADVLKASDGEPVRWVTRSRR